MDKNVKAILKINDVLDDRYQKLCDKYEALRLSHNRKKTALKRLDYIVSSVYRWDPRQQEVVYEICKIIDYALWSDGRVYLKKGDKHGK